MNNIYVDELPKSCKECGHTIYWDIDDVFVCSLDNRNSEHLEGDDYKKGLKLNSCPLKPLTDRLAEERKKVVQEIRSLSSDYFEFTYCDECGNTDYNDVVLTGKDLIEILDDVERGE